jgi:hypothetical protein
LYASATSVTETKYAEMDRMSRNDQGEIFGRPKHRREDNIQIYLRNIRREIVGWLQPAQERFPMTALCEHGDNLIPLEGRKVSISAEKLIAFERKSYSKASVSLHHHI